RSLRGRAVGAASCPLFGGPGTWLSWLVIVIQQPATRWAGIGWLLFGLGFYFVSRRAFVREPLSATLRAPALVLGPALQLEYRMIVVPVVRSYESEEAL